jgi:hypothetical protein
VTLSLDRGRHPRRMTSRVHRHGTCYREPEEVCVEEPTQARRRRCCPHRTGMSRAKGKTGKMGE